MENKNDSWENQNKDVPTIPASTQPATVQRPQRTWGVILVVLLVAAVSAGGVLAYNQYLRQPEKKILKALEQTSAAQSFAYSGRVTFILSPDTQAQYDQYLNMAVPQAGEQSIEKLEFKFSGAWESQTEGRDKWLLSFLISTFPDQGLAVGFEMRTVNNTFYAQLTGDSKVPSELNAYTNKWIKADISSYLEKYGLNDALPASTTASDKPTLDDIRDDRIKEMVRNARIVSINSVSTRKLDGQSFDVYNLTLQKENLRQLVWDIAAFENSKITQREKDRIEKSLDELQEATGEVMVGKKDGMLYRINALFTTTKKERVEFEMSFTDFNKPITVAEPENAMPIEELIGQLFGSLMQGYPTSTFSTDFDLGASSSESTQLDFNTQELEEMGS